MTIPDSRLPPEAQPWRRWVEETLLGTKSSLEVTTLSAGNTARAVNSSSTMAAETYNNLEETKVQTSQQLNEMADEILAASNEAVLANGRVTWSLLTPTVDDGADKPVGAIWWKHDGAGHIIAQYNWNGISWNSVTLSYQVISSIDAGTITVGFIDAARIDANTIVANKLLVGDFTNLINDTEYLAPLGVTWFPSVNPAQIDFFTTSGLPGRALRLQANRTSIQVRSTDYVQVDSNRAYYFSLRYQSTAVGGNFALSIFWYKEDFTPSTVTPSVTIGLPASSWTDYSNIFTAPSDARFMRLAHGFNSGATSGIGYVGRVQMRVMSDGNLIVDGAITANKLTATAIDGMTITGSTIRTAASGARITLDSTNGLRGFNASNVVKTQLTTGGIFTAVDATITGLIRSAATGKRVELDNDSLIFYNAGGFTSSITANTGTAGAALLSLGTSGYSSVVMGPGAYGLPAGGSANMLITGGDGIALYGDTYVYGNAYDILGQLRAPYAMSAGFANIPSLAANSTTTVAVTFPSGRFSGTPVIVATGTNPTVTVAAGATTASGVTINVGNWGASTAAAVTNGIRWMAVRMTTTTGAG